MVKLVAATLAVSIGTVVLAVVLHVTPNKVPTTVEPVCITKTVEFPSIMEVVLTWQTPPEEVEQANTPAGAAAHDATEGLAAVPTAAHLVKLPMPLICTIGGAAPPTLTAN
jgi:hypothetical protein